MKYHITWGKCSYTSYNLVYKYQRECLTVLYLNKASYRYLAFPLLLVYVDEI